ESENRRFLDKLLEIGESDPGQILLPSSDETTWLYARYSASLERHFRLCQPSISVIQRILDKNLLAQAAARAGIAFLPSWEPQTTNDLQALAPTLPYPIVIKPRTHVNRLRNNKGVVVRSPPELLKEYELFVARERIRDNESPLPSNPTWPILQRFVEV